ncbi:hypothetical protein V2I01_21480 [Micromonospora sp. BRA006-A]|nr:hypothetical protein [Micromonospora sp. BRA006-A]
MPPPDPYPWWVAATLGFLLVGAAGLAPGGTAAGVRAARGRRSARSGRRRHGGAHRRPRAGHRRARRRRNARRAGHRAGVDAAHRARALAAGGYALARRPAADFVLALAGACLTLFAGATNLAALSRAIPRPPARPCWSGCWWWSAWRRVPARWRRACCACVPPQEQPTLHPTPTP